MPDIPEVHSNSVDMTETPARPDTVAWLVCLVCATVVVIAALSVLVGWVTGHQIMTRTYPGWLPMHVTTALSLSLAGLGLLALNAGYLRLALGCGGLILVLVLAGVARSTLGLQWGFDWAFMSPIRNAASLEPGRMSAIVALALGLTGSALVAAALNRSGASFTLSRLLGGMTVALATVCLLGQMQDLEVHRIWGEGLWIGQQSSLLILFAGIGVLAHSASVNAHARVVRNANLPLLTGVAGTLLSAWLWQSMAQEQIERTHSELVVESKLLTALIEDSFEVESRALDRMARRWEASNADLSQWRQDAANHARDSSFYRAMALINVDSQLQAIEPHQPYQSLVDMDIRQLPHLAQLMSDARRTGAKAISEPSELILGGTGIFFMVPVKQMNGIELLGASIHTSQWLEAILNRPGDSTVSVAVRASGISASGSSTGTREST